MPEYRVEGQRSSDADWELILATSDPIEAVECAHYVEGWFWRRLWEDDQLVIERM